MYAEVKLCVQHRNSVSDFVQGEITSPILFSLFLNDIEMQLQNNVSSGLTIDQLSIYILLFADDAVCCQRQLKVYRQS